MAIRCKECHAEVERIGITWIGWETNKIRSWGSDSLSEYNGIIDLDFDYSIDDSETIDTVDSDPTEEYEEVECQYCGATAELLEALFEVYDEEASGWKRYVVVNTEVFTAGNVYDSADNLVDAVRSRNDHGKAFIVIDTEGCSGADALCNSWSDDGVNEANREAHRRWFTDRLNERRSTSVSAEDDLDALVADLP